MKKGSEISWGIYMACHGDIGQGLTDEWRDAFGVEDRNCWQSDCHGPATMNLRTFRVEKTE